MVTVDTILQVIPAISVSIAAIYYALTLRKAEKDRQTTIDTRQAQLFMQIREKWDIDMIRRRFEIMSWEWDDYHDFIEKYGPDTNPDAWSKLISMGQFFEGIGVLVKRGFIDPALVDDLLSGPIIQFWEKTEPFFVEMREVMKWPQAGEWLEYLYNQIKPIVVQQHPELKT
jgi:hypothetical protein